MSSSFLFGGGEMSSFRYLNCGIIRYINVFDFRVQENER